MSRITKNSSSKRNVIGVNTFLQTKFDWYQELRIRRSHRIATTLISALALTSIFYVPSATSAASIQKVAKTSPIESTKVTTTGTSGTNGPLSGKVSGTTKTAVKNGTIGPVNGTKASTQSTDVVVIHSSTPTGNGGTKTSTKVVEGPSGPAGIQGPAGIPGIPGIPGLNGTDGITPTISVGTVTAGSTPAVVKDPKSTQSNAILNFVLPEPVVSAGGGGGAGAPGAPGAPGSPLTP